MRDLLALAIAGAAGTVGRWVLSRWVYRVLGERFAYGTLAVNVLGCFAIGVLMEAIVTTTLVPTAWRVPLTVGFLGGFTTFSAFGYETLRFAENGAWPLAAANVAANVVLGLGATWLGFAVARGAL